MILLILLLAVHHLHATTFVLQDITQVECSHPGVRCIYSSDCFENKGGPSSIIFGDDEIDVDEAKLMPNCSMIIFRLPTGNSRRSKLSVTVKQLAPGNSHKILLTTLTDKKIIGTPFIGCIFEQYGPGKEGFLGAHFGVTSERSWGPQEGLRNSMIQDGVEWNREKPYSCMYEVYMNRVNDVLKNRTETWNMMQTKMKIVKRTDPGSIKAWGPFVEEEDYYIDKKTINLYNFLFEKRPKDDIEMKKYFHGVDNDFRKECTDRNVNCFLTPECIQNGKFDHNHCPAIFIIRYNNDHTEVTLENLGQNYNQTALILHKENGRTDKFECRKENKKINFTPTSGYVSEMIDSHIDPNWCTFKILSKDTNEIFDINALSWEINDESHYQPVIPGQLHWNSPPNPK